MRQDRIVELYRSELWECQLLESILKDEGIDCFLTNSVRSGYAPIIAAAQQVQIMIRESDLPRAGEILEAFRRNNQE
ncbi:DUF2007 domain-containing protein [Bacteroides sp.]|uniref:putative signal transducing protein n=1 Tax=Bacteroides sp. TaxID=29523 RepID=UPI0025911146|nr:DUF2007 domain-containing protein [Bacteroides sp.]